MIEQQDHFKFFIEDDVTFEDYIKEMKKDGVWGGNLEIYVSKYMFLYYIGHFNEVQC